MFRHRILVFVEFVLLAQRGSPARRRQRGSGCFRRACVGSGEDRRLAPGRGLSHGKNSCLSSVSAIERQGIGTLILSLGPRELRNSADRVMSNGSLIINSNSVRGTSKVDRKGLLRFRICRFLDVYPYQEGRERDGRRT